MPMRPGALEHHIPDSTNIESNIDALVRCLEQYLTYGWKSGENF